MIIEFSVGNFRSVKEMQTLSFQATGLKSTEKNARVDENNIVEAGDLRLLKTVGIYGANASGKSNIMKALFYFIQAIKQGPEPESKLNELYQPYLLDDGNDQSSCFFQIVFLVEGKKYRYGFTIRKSQSASAEDYDFGIEVESEWLFSQKETNTVKIFTRTGQNLDLSGIQNAKEIPGNFANYRLFLHHAAAFNEPFCSAAWAFLRREVMVIPDGKSELVRRLTVNLIDQYEGAKLNLLETMAQFGFSFEDVFLEKDDSQTDLKNFPIEKIYLVKEGRRFSLGHHESNGTKKLFSLLGLIWGASQKYRFVAIDELDDGFHPAFVRRLLELFNDKAVNVASSQLLFISHETTVLDPAIMRRDQIYFAEKKSDDATQLYSLSDLKGIRNDADFARQYLAGLYGGIPMLQSLKKLKPEDHE